MKNNPLLPRLTRQIFAAALCPLAAFTELPAATIDLADYVLQDANYDVGDPVTGDLSGVTYSSVTDTLFTVVNGATLVVELNRDGTVTRTINLTGFNDTVQHGLKRYPVSIPLHREAAFHQLRLGRKAAVEERFAELRERHPTLRPRLFHEEGTLWSAGGHPENAHRCFERALASLNQLPATKQDQPGLRSLRAEILKLLER